VPDNSANSPSGLMAVPAGPALRPQARPGGRAARRNSPAPGASAGQWRR
jgi:hypothetical protein